MKKIKTLAAVIAAFSALFFAGCGDSDSSSSDAWEVKPGTLGTADSSLLAAADVATGLGNDAVLFYYRADGNYSKWGLWLWTPGSSEGQAGYDATVGKATVVTANGKKIAYWNLSSLTASLSSLQKIINNKTIRNKNI